MEASSLLEEQRQSAITRQLAAWAGMLAIPTAISGIFGMNFVRGPSSLTGWGSFATFSTMAAICDFIYWRFRHLGWLKPLKAADAGDQASRHSGTARECNRTTSRHE